MEWAWSDLEVTVGGGGEAGHEMLLQVPAIVQEPGVATNMDEQYLLDERSQLLMSWLKDVAP